MTLYRGHILSPTKVLIWDPNPVGLPEISTVAHIKDEYGHDSNGRS